MSAITTLPVVSDMLNKNISAFRAALPKIAGISAERLIRVALTEFNKNPRLRECSPISFCSAVMQAAQMGLEFGEMKHCALVPYKDECKLLVQYQGWLALLWRSKAIKTVAARAVYEGDLFRVTYGSESKVMHEPKFESSEPKFYYAIALLPDGNEMFEIMPIAEIEAHMKTWAKGLDKKDSPWNTSFDMMAKKTVLRRLIKLLPLDVDAPVLTALECERDVWEADVKEERMQKFHAISAAPDLPTADEKTVAVKCFWDAVETAKKLQIPMPSINLPQNPEALDVRQLRAITDLINERCQGPASGGNETTYE